MAAIPITRIRELIAQGIILLLDISHWQGKWDSLKAKAEGIKGVYIKVGDPDMFGWADTTYPYYREKAVLALMDYGGYWFFRPEHNGITQAKKFIELMGLGYTLRPVVDVEKNVRGVSRSIFRLRLKNFLQYVEKDTGNRCIIYTRASFWDPQLGNEAWMSDYEFMVANYTENPVPILPICVGSEAIWQRYADGDMLGAALGFESYSIDVDLVWPATKYSEVKL